ncbi:MAG: hypothetical protein ACU85V_14060 [Gammaproteobacteria bacterium]
MSEDDAGSLSFELEVDAAAACCTVVLHGAVTRPAAQALMRELWSDPRYAGCRAALWDVSGSELPEFNALLGIADFVMREKAGRGPAILAFVSPAFRTSVLVRALGGFQRMLRLNTGYFVDEDTARLWIEERLENA